MRCQATAEERKAAVATEKCMRCDAGPGERCLARRLDWFRADPGKMQVRTSNVHVLRIYALRRTRRAAQ
jgi:hypothetical protein